MLGVYVRKLPCGKLRVDRLETVTRMRQLGAKYWEACNAVDLLSEEDKLLLFTATPEVRDALFKARIQDAQQEEVINGPQGST